MLNQMRSRKTLPIAAGLLLALLFVSVTAAVSFAQDQFDLTGEKQLVELINQERARDGLPPLAVDERLTQAARRAHRVDGEAQRPLPRI